MIVLDTSAALHCLVATQPSPSLWSRVRDVGTIHVPHLIDVEVLSALRGLTRGGKLSADRARDAWADFDNLRMLRYPMAGLADLVWSLRHRLTTYDATFVALAQMLICPLVTCDQKLARAVKGEAEIELYPST